jgi:hypothetical protein
MAGFSGGDNMEKLRKWEYMQTRRNKFWVMFYMCRGKGRGVGFYI